MKNACIVGYGAIGPIHAAVLKDICDANFYALCEIRKDRAEKCLRKHKVIHYFDFDKMLEDENIDVVHICTPHDLHKDMTIKALKSGKDVVLEKPVTLTKEELHELMNFVKTARQKVCVVLQNRTNNSIKALKDMVDNDRSLGKLLGIKGIITWHRDADYYRSEPWRGKWSSEGGGLLINQAIHTLDLLTYLAGEVVSVRGSISTKSLDGVIEVEDTADALFKFKSGVIGSFYATNSYPISTPNLIELNFENATLRYADNCLYRINSDQVLEVVACNAKVKRGKSYWGSGHQNALQDFYTALVNGTDDFIDIYDAEHAMKILFAFYESAKNNNREVLIWK